MDDFKEYLLSKQIVSKKTHYYLNWVLQLYVFCKKDPGTQVPSNEISRYLSQLSKSQEEWQVQQAREAISLYMFFSTAQVDMRRQAQSQSGFTVEGAC